MLIDRLATYVRDTLNLTVNPHKWKDERRLPLFLRDDYVYYQVEIHGLEILLMIDVSDKERSPSTVGKHMEHARALWGGELVYVREQVNAYHRKRLIEAGIQFIVPNNQLYLPMLAIDLREYFRQKRKSVHQFSPATQALLLYRIYNRGRISPDRTPTEMALILGYSKMTMSRAFKEVDWALGEVFANEKENKARKEQPIGQELWEALHPYWRNPVSRRYYLPRRIVIPGVGLRAGLTALASYTMLAEPANEVYAVSASEWKTLDQGKDMILLDHPDVDTVEVEVWSYAPQLFEQEGLKGAVDPLSLYLALKESRDERVEMALEEILGGIGW